MKKMGKGLAAACMTLVLTGGAAAQPQSYYQGYVTDVNAVGTVVVIAVANGAGQLNCTGGASQFWVDPSTPIGHTQIALAISAKLSGTLVYVQGNGTCSTAWPTTNLEQVAAFDLKE